MAIGVTGDGAETETGITMTLPVHGVAGGGAAGIANPASWAGLVTRANF